MNLSANLTLTQVFNSLIQIRPNQQTKRGGNSPADINGTGIKPGNVAAFLGSLNKPLLVEDLLQTQSRFVTVRRAFELTAPGSRSGGINKRMYRCTDVPPLSFPEMQNCFSWHAKCSTRRKYCYEQQLNAQDSTLFNSLLHFAQISKKRLNVPCFQGLCGFQRHPAKRRGERLLCASGGQRERAVSEPQRPPEFSPVTARPCFAASGCRGTRR